MNNMRSGRRAARLSTGRGVGFCPGRGVRSRGKVPLQCLVVWMRAGVAVAQWGEHRCHTDARTPTCVWGPHRFRGSISSTLALQHVCTRVYEHALHGEQLIPSFCVGRGTPWMCTYRSRGRGVIAGRGGCRRLHTAPHPPPCSAACSAAARRRTISPAPRAARAVVPAAHPTRLLLENESPAAASSICRCPMLPVRPRLLPHLVRALACRAGVCITWRGMAWRVC